MKNLSSELQIFTDVEMTTLETLIEETEVSLSLSPSLPPLPYRHTHYMHTHTQMYTPKIIKHTHTHAGVDG